MVIIPILSSQFLASQWPPQLNIILFHLILSEISDITEVQYLQVIGRSMLQNVSSFRVTVMVTTLGQFEVYLMFRHL